MKFVHVVGTRPHLVKLASLHRALRRVRGVQQAVIHTGQHYERMMSSAIAAGLGLPVPDVQLAATLGARDPGAGGVRSALAAPLRAAAPDWVLVYGDCDSTLAGAQAAADLGLPVAHVEAGLRSGNARMREEQVRIAVDHLTRRLYAPTTAAVRNLYREGIPADRVLRVGDVMYDVLVDFLPAATTLDRWGTPAREHVLVTIHRAETTDRRPCLDRVLTWLADLAQERTLVFPLHHRTRRAAARLASLDRLRCAARVVRPTPYLEMLALERQARVIVTDSGGLQREAAWLGVPCVLLRPETEWPELVDSGHTRLAHPETADLDAVLRDVISRPAPAPWRDRYTDGRAGERIAIDLTERGHAW